jgi:hypothetical protein
LWKLWPELGLQQDPQYGLSLVALGELESEQGRLKEALVFHERAKAVLARRKERHE